MREREPAIAAATIALLLLIWTGGFIEPSPYFAGSALGGALALSGTLLLLLPLLFSVIKRNERLKVFVTRHIPVRTIVIWHIYSGFLGTLLIVLHTGHKFDSVLASSLMAFTLIVVFSGVIGRYLQRQIGDDVRDKRRLLNNLYEEYDQVSARPTGTYKIAGVVNLVSSMADVEFAITARETLKQWLTVWHGVHITLIIGMCLLLFLHIWSGIHFGLRWL